MDLYLRILPVFLVMGLGILGKRLGFFPESFVEPANRLIFYFAVPFLVFLKVSGAPFRHIFQASGTLSVMGAYLVVLAGSILLSRYVLRGSAREALRSSFVVGSTHGNFGYVGLAVIYYAFGDEGLAAGGLIMAVLVLMQHLGTMFVLTRFPGTEPQKRIGFGGLAKSLAKNPVLIALWAAALWSVLGWSLPPLAQRPMEIVADMALPMALLIIGASLSFTMLTQTLPAMALCAALKVLVLPAVGTVFLWFGHVPDLTRAAAVVLLAAPTATVTVVLVGQLGGSVRWTANAVSFSTLCSAAAYWGWMLMLQP